MKKIIFKNSRNLDLAGNLYSCNSEKIVIMCHGFTSDKHSRGRFEKMAMELNESGIDALAFDFGGCGESEDEFLTVDNQVDDLKSAVKYVKCLGYKKLAFYGHSLGTLICLKSFSNEISAMVLSGACTGPMYYNWDEYFDKDEMLNLREKGFAFHEVESQWREHTKINNQTLLDFQQVHSQTLLENVTCPVLVIHGDNDEEEKLLLDNSKNAIKYLSSESKIEVIHGATHSFYEHYYDVVINFSKQWYAKYLLG